MSAYAAFYCPLNGFHCDAQLIAVNLGKAAGEAFFTSSQYSTAAGSFTCMARSMCVDPSVQLQQGPCFFKYVLQAWPAVHACGSDTFPFSSKGVI